MMGEPKAFASLNAGLLARKGAARPAMRRQAIGGLGMAGLGTAGLGMASAENSQGGAQDDLGWNDMGFNVDPDPDPDRESAAPVLDSKSLLPASVMGHAENGEDADDLPGAPPVPEVVRQRAELSERLEGRAAAAGAGGLIAPESRAPKNEAPENKAKRRTSVRNKKSDNAAGKVAGSTVRARDKAAFTLRLDADRHLSLRLASAVSNTSSQAILIGLLDEYLASLPEIADLATRIPAAPPKRCRQAD